MSTDQTRELEAFAEQQGLPKLDIVFARPVNTHPSEPSRFYLMAEDGSLLYQPRDIGRTFEAARAFIREKAMQRAAFIREMNRPYYGG